MLKDEIIIQKVTIVVDIKFPVERMVVDALYLLLHLVHDDVQPALSPCVCVVVIENLFRSGVQRAGGVQNPAHHEGVRDGWFVLLRVPRAQHLECGVVELADHHVTGAGLGCVNRPQPTLIYSQVDVLPTDVRVRKAVVVGGVGERARHGHGVGVQVNPGQVAGVVPVDVHVVFVHHRPTALAIGNPVLPSVRVQEQIVQRIVEPVKFQESPICIQRRHPIQPFVRVLGRVISAPGTILVGEPSPVELNYRGLADVHHSAVRTVPWTNENTNGPS